MIPGAVALLSVAFRATGCLWHEGLHNQFSGTEPNNLLKTNERYENFAETTETNCDHSLRKIWIIF